MTTASPLPHRFNVEEYHLMAGAGLFGEDDRVELVGGEIIDLAPIGSRHAAAVDRLNRLLVTRLGDRAIVRVQSPVRLDDLSEPQPDVTVLKPRPDFYSGDHPGPAEILLVVEVADASAAWDRGVKVPLYAEAGWSRHGWSTWSRRWWRSSAGPAPAGTPTSAGSAGAEAWPWPEQTWGPHEIFG